MIAYRIILLFTFLCCTASGLFSQIDSVQNAIDTIPVEQKVDGLSPNPSVDTRDSSISEQVKFSESKLNEEIIYGAVDSQRYDNKAKLMYLFGDAFVNYEDKELKADLIILDMENKIAEAKISPYRRNKTKPTFKDAEKVYEYNGLKYNFETEKGIVYGAVTSEGEFKVHGEKTKYVGGGDQLYGESDVIYNQNSIITTCNHPGEPHFGFKAKKLKVISDKVAIAGPSNLQLSGIPTPLWIPFGFFPLTDGTTSGLIFPEGFQFYSKDLGFGLSGIGWYFPLNDFVHTKLTADIYARGTHALYSSTEYRKKYKYNGLINLSYNNSITEVISSENGFDNQSDKSFRIEVRHNQDPKAHPYRTLGGNIRIVGNNNLNKVNNDAGSVLNNVYTSNFNFTHKMPRTPFSFRMGMSHSQNTQTNKMIITLPDASLTMNTIYPFESKNVGNNKKKWYEKIALSYNSKLKVQTSTTDTTLFSRETIQNSKAGIDHDLTLSHSTRVLKYYNISPNINYSETWVLNTIESAIAQSEPFATIGSTMQDTVDWQIDSLYQTRDSLVTDILSSGGAYRTMNAGVTLSTQIFGTKTFARGPIRGIRHLIKPSITYGYNPNQLSQIDSLQYSDGSYHRYTKFDQGPFGSPSFSDLNSSLSYSIGNVLEMKYFSKKDSTEKKVKIFDSVNISGSYNFAADNTETNLKWSTTSIRSTSRFFKGMTNLNTNWTFDPYVRNGNTRTNKTLWSEKKKLVGLVSGRIDLNTSLTVSKLRKILSKKKDDTSKEDEDDELIMAGDYADAHLARGSINVNDNRQKSEHDLNDPDHKHEQEESKRLSIFSILDKFSIRHNFSYTIDRKDEITTKKVSVNGLNLTGSFVLTPNWSVNIGTVGYDFVNKGPTYSTVSFIRKLHCWDMRVTWIPTGANNSYTFFIGVSSGTLSFLKYNYGQNNDPFSNRSFGF